MHSKFWLAVIAALVAVFPALTGCRPTTAVLGDYSSEGQADAGHSDAGTREGFPLFGPAEAISSVLAPGDVATDPTTASSGVELLMMSTRAGNKDVWRSTRTSTNAVWGPPTLVSELRSAATDSNPKVSATGLRLWFYSDRDRSVGTLWEATRNSVSEAFASPTVIPGLSTTGASDVSACANDDATIAVVATLLGDAPTGYDLFESRRSSASDAFGRPVALKNVNSSSNDFDPWLSPNGLVLVFHSNRDGGDDLFWASRQTLDDDFASAAPIAELNTGFSEMAPALAPDLSRIWFASTRDGDETIYEAAAID